MEHFTVHDLRRTGSTLLNELGFNRDWIEKCLAHEEGRSSRGVYNKAEYEVQRCHMLQEWADLIDAWVSAETPSPAIFPQTWLSMSPDLARRIHRCRLVGSNHPATIAQPSLPMKHDSEVVGFDSLRFSTLDDRFLSEIVWIKSEAFWLGRRCY